MKDTTKQFFYEHQEEIQKEIYSYLGDNSIGMILRLPTDDLTHVALSAGFFTDFVGL